MNKERAWSVRAMYILIAAALAMSLIIFAAPAQRVSAQVMAAPDEVKAEWEMTDTPTIDGWVLGPESVIYDYALASEGGVAYAVVQAYDETCVDDVFADYGYRLLKSTNGAATWTDLTDNLMDAIDEDDFDFDVSSRLLLVATDWVDPDFVAVALRLYDETAFTYVVAVCFSTDGGDTFNFAGVVEDENVFLDFNYVSDLVVSLPVDGERDIAIGGQSTGIAVIFQCTVTGETASEWENATVEYDGWNDTGAFTSLMVTDLIFSPNWPTDRTILAVTYGPTATGPGPFDVHLQSGTWGKTSGAWNEDAGFADAVLVKAGVGLPTFFADSMFNARAIAGVALPDDYDGSDPIKRWAWVWVNYYTFPAGVETGEIIMIDDSLATPVNQQIVGMPWLTNVSYLGTIAQGKAIAGVLGDGAGDFVACCLGVRVYDTGENNVTNMNICCEPWQVACKLPSGRAGMAVSYVDANNAGDSKPDKAYAVALYGIPYPDDGIGYISYDESAWSVSVDGDGLIWNQLSLVDTYISYASDVAVSPDCNKMMLATVNEDEYDTGVPLPPPFVCYIIENDLGGGLYDLRYPYCDSVWLKATTLPEDEEYSGYWIRTWFGLLMGDNSNDFPGRIVERSLLRLAPEEDTGDTVYLVDRMSGTVYYNDLETWNCWTKGASSIHDIVDLAVLDEATIYALGEDGKVAMSDDHGKAVSWTDPVESELEEGWTIEVTGDWVLVGGQDGDVSYSDDGGETFTDLDKVYDDSGVYVTVAFDTYFDTNGVVYAGLAHAYEHNGIFSTTIPDSTGWTDLGAAPYNYRGIVLSYPDGNTFTSPETGGVLYAAYFTYEPELTDNCDVPGCDIIDDLDAIEGECWHSGVARSLTPIVAEEVCGICETEWDYLTWGLDYDTSFVMIPDTLKVCGCTDPSTNTKLFAIDGPNPDVFESYDYYDMCAGEQGTVWTFEDCYAKKAVEITSPAEGFVVGTSACECCNAPFTLGWERLCDACSYEIQFAFDSEFTQPYEPVSTNGDPLNLNFDCYSPGEEIGSAAAANPSAFITCGFLPETTYYWRIRATQAGTGQEIHSWWSEGQSFTVSPTAAAGAIELVSPVPGATNQPTKNVGFSWNMLADADSFDWKLDDNADFSSPLATKPGLTTKATSHAGPLTHGTTYYWMVTAYRDGSPISTSAVGTFTTSDMGSFCAQDGVCFDTQAELEEYNAEHFPTQVGTPFWVWVVIAIGAVLVIVVIVLIFRTRRV